MPDPRRGMPEQAKAMQMVTQISTGGLMLVLPAVGGWWLDQRIGTEPWFLIAGGMLGGAASFLHLLAITGVLRRKPPDSKRLK